MKVFAVPDKRPARSHRRDRAVLSHRVACLAHHSKESPVRRILRSPSLHPETTDGAPADDYAQVFMWMPKVLGPTSSSRVQRQDEPDHISDSLSSSKPTSPGREPSSDERRQWGDYFPDMSAFRILREPAYGYNCFAWAVGIDDRSITSRTINEEGYSPDLDGWTGYLKEKHSFVRYTDGPSESADLVLFGGGEGAIWHAASKAEQSFGNMTFSSKLGDYGKTPVILHALLDIQGKAYGTALRSFWRTTESDTPTEKNAIQRKSAQDDDKIQRQPLVPLVTDHQIGQLQRSPVFPDGSCGGQKVESRIERYVGIASEMVKKALLALDNPQDISGPLNRIFHIAPNETLYLFLLRENLSKLEQKLAAPVKSQCKNRSDLRHSMGKSPPRAYAELDPETLSATPDSGIVYNRNIFRITGFTIRREIINTVLHEYLHLVRVGHGEASPGAPIENKNSIKVRGLTKDEAINNAESHVRFIRAVT